MYYAHFGHSKPPFFAEMKQAMNGNIKRMGLMIVRTNIINTKEAFTLADNVDCGVHVIRPFSNFNSLVIDVEI